MLAGKEIRKLKFGRPDSLVLAILRRVLRDSRAVARKEGIAERFRLDLKMPEGPKPAAPKRLRSVRPAKIPTPGVTTDIPKYRWQGSRRATARSSPMWLMNTVVFGSSALSHTVRPSSVIVALKGPIPKNLSSSASFPEYSCACRRCESGLVNRSTPRFHSRLKADRKSPSANSWTRY